MQTNLNNYTLMAQYNQWMNLKIYEICRAIPDDIRKKNLGAFFQSIHGTLNHLMYGDLAWMGRFVGRKLTDATIGIEIYSDFDELKSAREKLDQEIIDWTFGLTPAQLVALLTYKSGIDGKTRSIPLWILVTHMFNHQTHHRGQLTTLLNQMNIDYGVTDIPWMSIMSEYIVEAPV